MSVKLIWDAPPIRLRFLAGKDSSSAEEILPNLGMKAPVSEQAEISTHSGSANITKHALFQQME